MGERLPNPQWRPFLGKRELGRTLPYRLSEQAMKTKLAILSAFFQFLIQEEYMDRNPALLLQRVNARNSWRPMIRCRPSASCSGHT